jgi:hypothetical protein
VVANVFEPAAGAVSAIRMTSPPMLLGRKLLKKLATRNDEVRRRKANGMSWASSSRPQRQALRRIMPRYRASAATSQGTDAVRATVHSRATSTLENRKARRAMLTPALTSGTTIARARDGRAASLSLCCTAPASLS